MRHSFASVLASMGPLRTYQRTYAKLRPRRGARDKAFHSESKPGH